MRQALLTVAFASLVTSLHAEQMADTAFHYRPERPEYPGKNGPVVYVDEAHHNFHTLGARYHAFGQVLKDDGYRVAPSTKKFTGESLKGIGILVIANASAENDNWKLPTPSAFTAEEAATLKKWVQGGGSLFLIADHMPCPGAVRDIADVFNINMYNGEAKYMKEGPETFTRASGLLLANAITNGRNISERVDSITIFGGHAILPNREASGMIRFSNDHRVFFPKVAGQFTEETAYINAGGLFLSVYFREGRGRVVIAAEAAMFSAQLAGPDKRPFGMNEPVARKNPQILLNIIHWLDRRFD